MTEHTTPDKNEEPEATTIIAAKADDAVIIGADKQSTGRRALKTDKLVQLHDRGVMGTAGKVADIQVFRSQVEARLAEYKLRRGKQMRVETVIDTLQNTISPGTGFVFPEYLSNLVYAGYSDEPRVAQVSFFGTRTTDEDFLAVGSGAAVARGSLGTAYEPGHSVDEVRDIVITALRQAAEQGPFTGIGIDIAVIDEDGTTLEKGISIDD